MPPADCYPSSAAKTLKVTHHRGFNKQRKQATCCKLGASSEVPDGNVHGKNLTH